MSSRRRFNVGPLLIAGVVILANETWASEPSSRSAETYVSMCSGQADASGDDCAHVLQVGPSGATRILVLLPGGSEAAGALTATARYISKEVPGMQVWAMDRREQDLADLSGFGSPEQQDYYLNGKYRHLSAQQANRAGVWGLATAIADLDQVVAAAHAGGRQVYLGGHSWGATLALAYAAWDLGGHPGYKSIRGLILIDGGVHGSFAGEGYNFHVSLKEAKKRLDGISQDKPFTGDLNYLWQLSAPPQEVPIYYQLAASLALRKPHDRSPLQALLPKSMQPNVQVTNAALLGWLIDTHAPVADLQAHSGHMDPGGGDLTDWISDGPANIQEIAAAFAGPQPAALEWYWPRRLSLDLEAIDPFIASPVTQMLGLPITHGAEIDVPMFVFATGLTHGTVISAARWVAGHSRITRATYVTDDSMSHLDPLLDAPSHNRCLSSVVLFLKGEPLSSATPRAP